MQPRVTVALKVLIGVLIALLLLAQIVIIPLVASEMAFRNPDLAFLEVPGIIAAIAFLVLVETVLFCIWRLLSLVRADAIFSPRAFRYVNVIIGALVIASLLIAASFVTLSLTNAVNPGILLLAVIGVVIGVALALLVVVLRGLLGAALQLEQDLSEVV